MEASSSSSRFDLRRTRPGECWIGCLGAELLCAIFALLDHFDLVHCSSVCKSWHNVIYSSPLMRDLYYKKNVFIKDNDISIPQNTSMMAYFKDLAMEQHRLAFLNVSSDVHQWSGHSVRVNLCRMKRGLILTGVGDKVLRLWSAESYKCLDEYSVPGNGMNKLVDYDFDENKIVGLTDAQICIWRHNTQRSIFRSHEGTFRALCMSYIDPEAVVGCEDGRARIFDMYSGSCSRIFRMHVGPLTCLALTDEQLIFGGSTFGTIAIADFSSGEQQALLRSSFVPTGMKTLCFNACSSLLFAGSSSGYAHCWDIRTMRPVWEKRVSPNVIYAVHHLPYDTSTLAIGGLDGMLRILNQSTGEVLSSFVMEEDGALPNFYRNSMGIVQRRKGRKLSEYTRVDCIPRHLRPPITCLAVGMKKIVTTHNEKYIRMWRFHE